jgi:hypothetical protein
MDPSFEKDWRRENSQEINPERDDGRNYAAVEPTQPIRGPDIANALAHRGEWLCGGLHAHNHDIERLPDKHTCRPHSLQQSPTT